MKQQVLIRKLSLDYSDKLLVKGTSVQLKKEVIALSLDEINTDLINKEVSKELSKDLSKDFSKQSNKV